MIVILLAETVFNNKFLRQTRIPTASDTITPGILICKDHRTKRDQEVINIESNQRALASPNSSETVHLPDFLLSSRSYMSLMWTVEKKISPSTRNKS
jgi:hypothetical protein